MELELNDWKQLAVSAASRLSATESGPAEQMSLSASWAGSWDADKKLYSF